MQDYVGGDIKGYLEDLSGRKITPGGGSAAALTAAVGAALNMMVVNFSGGKDGDIPEELSELKKRQEESLENLTALVDQDCRAFKALMKALKEKTDVQSKYKEAAIVPMEVCRECRKSIEASEALLKDANKNLISDIGCAAHTLKGAFYSASLNVRINLNYIQDAEFVEDAENELKSIKSDIDRIEEEISGGVTSIMNSKGQNG